MRRFVLFCALACLLSASVLVSAQGADSVLQVVDVDPARGTEIEPSGTLSVYFDHLLDCQTAQSAVTVEDASTAQDVLVSVTCEGAVLSISPQTPYERATSYRLLVNTSLRAEPSAQLLEPFVYEFSTAGFLRVAQVFPAPQSSVENNSPITLIFNRPVVPLLLSTDSANLPNPLNITPTLSGKGEWVNTSIYTFTPDEGLLVGTDYRVNVDLALSAEDGATLQASAPLDEQGGWQFSVMPASLIEYVPAPDAVGVALDEEIEVRFSAPMDIASVEQAFSFKVGATPLQGTFTWADDQQGFRFQPNQALALDTTYEVNIAPTARARGGGIFANDGSWRFSTVPAPSITSTSPFDGQTDAAPYGGFEIYFASPMDYASLLDKFSIEPKPWREPDFYYREWSNSLQVSFPTEPSTTYRVNIAAGMKDVYGNQITQPFSFGYSTAAYDPSFGLRVPSGVGFYNAEREPTALFITHTNIDQLDLKLYSVDPRTLVSLLEMDSYDPAYNFDTTNLDSEFVRLVRQWSIPSVAPENALRYEYIELAGDSSTGVTCGNYTTRLQVGGRAIVLSDPDPVRARSAPKDGEIVELLYKNYALEVLSGPTCLDGIAWWEVSLRDGSSAWVAEAVEGEVLVGSAVPVVETPVEVTDAQGGKLPPGVYLLEVNSPTLERRYNSMSQKHIMVVSSFNVTLKNTIDGVMAWVTDAQTGAPVADASVTVGDYFSDEYKTYALTTDADGIASTQLENRPRDLYDNRFAIVQKGDQFGFGFSGWTNGVEPYAFGVNPNYYPRRYNVYVYTDRPVYRPDQPVYFKGIIRLKDDVSYFPPDLRQIRVTIMDGNGQYVLDEEIPVNENGSFSASFDLAPEAALGYYYLEVVPPTPNNVDWNNELTGVSFTVAEYRLPEFQVTAQALTPEVVQKDDASVSFEARYFFGGAVSNADVNYSISRENYFFDYQGENAYDFVDYNYDGGPGEFMFSDYALVSDGLLQTDAEGNLALDFPADIEDARQSQLFTVEANISDESDQSVSGRTTLVVHQGLFYVGSRALSYVATAGEESTLEVITVDWDSQIVPNQTVSVDIIERRWSSVQERDSDGRTTWSYEVEEIPVLEGQTLTTNAEGIAQLAFTPPNGGVYKLVASARDERGNLIRSSTTFWVSDTEYVSWRQQNSNRIDLITDKQDYQIGETAQILITSPFQGTAEALVTVERGRILQTQRLTLTSNSAIYELPITEDLAPNVFIGVLIIKGVDESNPVAAFRMGYAQLSVDAGRKVLNIAIESDLDQAQPQQTVTYTVKTTDYTGAPVPAELGVAVTDLAALSLMPPNSGRLLDTFYGTQSLAVRSALGLTINTDQITQEVLDTVKGGGGGGLSVEGVLEVRGEFVDTPYWNANIVTDADGTASFEVRLPDNLTTWRLDARGISLTQGGNLLVGQDTFDLLSTKPLIIRPVTPRFFVVDDSVVLSAVLNNNTSEVQQVVVTLNQEGLSLLDEAQQVVDVPAGGRTRVTWRAKVNDVPQVVASFSADAGNYQDASISGVALDEAGTLPVYRYEVPETVGTAGVLRGNDSRTESIVLPSRFQVAQGELNIKVDTSLASATLDGLQALEAADWYSIEGTISLLLPNIATVQALQAAGVEEAELRAQLDQQVNLALQRLYAEQKADGGWGWSLRENSDTLTTAYAVLGISKARDAGYPIAQDVLDNAIRFVRSGLSAPSRSSQKWQLDRQAFLLFVLSEAGRSDIARMSALFEERARLSLYARSLLGMGLYQAGDSARATDLLNDVVASASISATGAHWDDERDYWNWNSDTRSTAMGLMLLNRLQANNTLIPNVVSYLMVMRRGDMWETRHETAWVLWALSEFMASSGDLQPNYAYRVEFNGDPLTQGFATPENVRDSQNFVLDISNLFKDQANRLTLTRTLPADAPDNGALYYTAHLRAFLPVAQIDPLSRGVSVARTYSLANDPEGTPITSARVGDVIRVHLTVIAPNDLYYVVVEDFYPAGTEAINTDLLISQQIGTEAGILPDQPNIGWWMGWYFADIQFRDQKAVFNTSYLPAGTYEYSYTVRAGFAGDFNVIPPIAYETYFPEVYGRGAGLLFSISE